MNTNKAPVISTTNGLVRGLQRNTIYGDQYYCFDGIPYAKPPVGHLRFKAPEALEEKWQGIRDCTTVPTKSMQYNRYTNQKEGGEDCLYLNIYVKKLESNAPLPVMVFIHGGGFNTGDATRHSWGPDYFMMQDVVFVAVAHRLGALGFLSFSDPTLEVSGNAGLKDQVMALKWIKNNCSNFNGDPENITLMGHSSGAVSTHLLMFAPQCQGLFHKAILMSGYCFNIQRQPNLPYRLACKLGYSGENIDRNIYEFLMQQDAAALVGLQIWTQDELDRCYEYVFTPCIEASDSPNAIITKEPMEMMRNAWGNEIPLMLGATSFEGLIRYRYFTESSELYERLRERPEYILPQELQFKCDIGMQKELAKDYLRALLGTKGLQIENALSVMNLHSFNLIYHSQHRTILSRLMNASAPTYLYRFDFDSPEFNLYRLKQCGPGVHGVSHVDDLSYIFLMPASYKLSEESSEYQTIIRMINLWTNFAAKSDPNADIIKPIVWKPIERHEKQKCLNISYTIKFMDLAEQKTCEFMDGLYERAGLELC